MKTDDDYFRGFPATWNLVAFYFFLLRPSETISLAAITILVVCTFLPFIFVHPMRVRKLRSLNIILCVAWGVLVVIALVRDFAPPSWVVYGLSIVAVYFRIAGLFRFGRKT
jgi:phosphatidylcholine synthase